MKTTNYLTRNSIVGWRLICSILVMLGLWTTDSYGQASSTYTFAQTSGTYTSISGTASSIGGDDGVQDGLPIGFSFTFGGTAYTTFGVSTNGFIKFESGTFITTSTPNYTNGIGATVQAPMAAIFWDDNNLTSGSCVYNTVGGVGGRVTTIQWTNDHMGGGGSTVTPTFSFQIKLYETTNVIQYIYGSTSGALTSSTASIGISSASGNFLSVTPGAPATTSIVTANDGISATTFLASGTTYTISPPVPAYCSPSSNNGGTVGDAITLVQVGGINYTTSTQTPSPGYLNLTSIVGTVNQGSTNAFTINQQDGGDAARIWVDFNNNGSFEDAGELLATTGTGSSVSGSIVIPAGAPLGNHRMRIRNTYNPVNTITTVTSCTTGITYGESKDFTLNIVLASCTNPTVTVTPSTTNICIGGSTVLVASGSATSYIWAPATGLNTTTGATVTANPAVTTIYTVTGSVAGGCSTTATATVTVSSPPTFTSVTANPPSVCINGSSTLTAAASAPIPSPIASYIFSQSTTTFTSILGAPGTVVVTTGTDDSGFGPFSLGFTFNYHGVNFTQFGVQGNGWIQMGAVTPGSNYLPLGSVSDAIAGFSGDLDGSSANGADMLYLVTGATGNHVLTVEWHNWGFWSGAANNFNFQIRLFEASGAVQFVYGAANNANYSTSTSGVDQVGLTGATVSDFQTRTGTGSWSATTNGGSNSSTVNYGNGFPIFTNGLTFTFAPPSTVTYSWSPATFLNTTSGSSVIASNISSNITYTVTATRSGGCSSTSTVAVSTGSSVSVSPTASYTPPPSPVTNYNFASSTTSYSSVSGGTTLGSSPTFNDDTNYGLQNIGFTFNYHGVNYTQFGISDNGYIRLGSTTTTFYGGVLAGQDNTIAAFNYDLLGNSGSHVLRYTTTGSVGSRVLTIEWFNWGIYNTGLNEMNFEIKLYETSNQVQVVYQPVTPTNAFPVTVGMTGTTISDFNDRTTTSNWSTSSAGGSNSATMTFNSSVFPSNGLTYTWTVPNQTPCGGTAAFNLAANASGGGLPYTYSWSPATGLSSTTIANPVATPLITTVYSITVTDNCGQQASGTVTTTVNPSPIVTVSPSSTSLCAGSSVVLTASGAASYSWSPSTGLSATTGSTVTASPTGTTNYTVTGTTGGCSSSFVVPVAVFTLPVITSTTANPQFVLSGGSSNLAVNVAGPSSYCNPTMFPTNPCNYLNSVTTTGGITNINSAVDAGYNGTGTTYFPTASVSQNPGSSFTLVCQAQGTCNIAYYQVWVDWNQDGVFSASEHIVDAAGLNSGNVVTSFVINVPVTAVPGSTRMRVLVDGNNISPVTACDNLSAFYSENEDYNVIIPGTAGGYTYSWSPATFLNSSTIASPTASNITATTAYTVTVTNSGGCSASDTVTVHIGSLVYTNTVVTQVSTPACVSPGALNVPILQMAVQLDGTAGTLNMDGFQVDLGGTGNPQWVSNAHIYYTGTSPVFATTTPYAVELSAGPSHGYGSFFMAPPGGVFPIGPVLIPTTATISYTETFTSGVTPSGAQAAAWAAFQASLTPQSYTKVTLKGSNDPIGVSITNPTVVAQIAAAMNTNSAGTFTDGVQTFMTGNCGGGLEITNTGSICFCNIGYTVRPMIGNSNWGGINGLTCGAATQTMTVEFTYSTGSSQNTTTTHYFWLAYDVYSGAASCGGALDGQISYEQLEFDSYEDYDVANQMPTAGNTPISIANNFAPSGNSITTCAGTTLTWSRACDYTGNYDVYLNGSLIASNINQTYATTPALSPGSTYTWQVQMAGSLYTVGCNASTFQTNTILAPHSSLATITGPTTGVCNNTYSYCTSAFNDSIQWQFSLNNITFFDLPGFNSACAAIPANLGPGTFYVRAYARAIGVCSSDTTYSNVLTVVINAPSCSVTSSASGPVCTGASVTLTSTGPSPYIWSTGATTQSIVVNPAVATTYSVTSGTIPSSGYSYGTSATSYVNYPTPGQTFISLSDDAVSGAVPIGFTFNFYGVNYSQAYVSSNGFLTFNSTTGNGCCTGGVLPNNNAFQDNLIALFWEDLFPPGGGTISYTTTGSVGSRIFIVTYSAVPQFGSGVPQTGQIVLHEGSNLIELMIGSFTSDNDGVGTTQGVENVGGTLATTTPGRNSSDTWSVSNTGQSYVQIPPASACNCTAFSTVTIGGPVAGSATFSPAAGCPGTARTLDAGTITGVVTGPVTYLWTPGGATTSTVVVNPTVTTTYTLHVQDNLCGRDTTITVPVNPNPVLTAINNGPVCSGGPVTLTATANGSSIVTSTASAYSFTSSNGTYSPISGGTAAFATGSFWDDNTMSGQSIGFTFNYLGTNYTTFGLDANGFIIMGSAGVSNTYCGPSSGFTNAIYPFGVDLISVSSSFGDVRFQTIGSSPNRQLVVQWSHVTHYPSGSGADMSFQLILNETTNSIQVVYGPCSSSITTIPGTCSDASTDPPGIGLVGATSSDFNLRSVTNGTNTWATSTAGGSLSAVVNYSPSLLPASGLTYTFNPPTPGTFTWAGGTSPANTAIVTANPTTTTTYTVSFTDVNGCSATTSTTVNTVLPTISCPADLTVCTDAGNCSAVVNNIGTATSPAGPCTHTISNNRVITPEMAGTMVYHIPLSQLINTPFNCGNSPYNGCAGDAGFSWTDATPGPPTSITVDFGQGVECHSNGTVHTTSLNGNSSPTYTVTSSNCSCSIFGAPVISINANTAGYVVGGTNTFMIGNVSTCLGFSDQTGTLGADYATITVNYVIPAVLDPLYNIGDNFVTWIVTDQFNNTASCVQKVTVNDCEAPTISCPANTLVSCNGGDTSIGANGTATATDNCSGVVTIVSSDVTVAGSCSANYDILRTWSATDAVGNISTCVQTIQVRDLVAPVIDGLCFDQTLECPDVPVFCAAYASDDCSTFTLTFADVTTPTCGGSYVAQRTWTATDACGNVSTAVETRTVEDVTAPVISGVGPTQVIMCPATPVFSSPTAADECSNTTTLTFFDQTITFCIGSYATVRTWTATDPCGNSSSEEQWIYVLDLDAPVISGVQADATIECPASPSWSNATAADACGNAYLTYDDQTTNGCGGSYTTTRTWTAGDDCGNSSSMSQTISVQDHTGPVIVNVNANSTIECPASPVFSNPVATDACSNNNMTFNDVTTALCGSSYSTTRTWTAIDDCGNITTASETINVEDHTGPVISGVGADQTIECPAAPVFSTPTQSDACGTSTMTFADVTVNGCGGSYTRTRTWTAVDGCGNTTTAHQVIHVEDHTGPVISGVGANQVLECPATPVFSNPTQSDACSSSSMTFATVTTNGCGTTYTKVRTWTATDACGNVTTASQTISVQDHTAPVINGVNPGQTIQCPATPNFCSPTASDVCNSVVLTYADVSVAHCGGTYTRTRTWTAIDACGNTTTASQIINVIDNVAPVITGISPAVLVIQCPATPTFGTAIVTDACSSAGITLSYNDVNTALCGGAYSRVRTWTATDGCGNVRTGVQTVNVIDNTAPVITGVAANASIGCPSTPTWTMPTATDACGSATIGYTDATTTICGGSYNRTRTWTATDGCGNHSTASRTVTVTDNVPPIITGVGANATINCPAAPVFSNPVATDVCGSATIAFVDVNTTICGGSYSRTRTWTATDACGNTATASQTITVQDITAPVLSNLGSNTTISCPAAPVFNTPVSTDACGTSTVTFTDATVTGCAGNYTVTRTWTAADGCGNSSSASRTITVQDVSAPVISGVGAAATINCPATPSFSSPTASDCGAATLTYADVTVNGTCPGNYVKTRTWTATDGCGYSSTASQVITVHDITPPTISCPATIYLCASALSPALTNATGSDGCSSVAISHSVCPANFPAGTTVITWTATDLCGNTATCTQNVIRDAAINVTIAATGGISGYCQGNNAVTLTANATGGTGGYTYLWSNGATTQSISVSSSATYSVVVTDAFGTPCSSNSVSYVFSSNSSSQLSSYTIIGRDNVHLHGYNVVQNGGIGATATSGSASSGHQGWIKLHDHSTATASTTFARAVSVSVDGTSIITNQILSAANPTLPTFDNGSTPNTTNVTVPAFTTVTLNGTVYGDITVGQGATLIFGHATIDLKSLVIAQNATVKGAQPCTRLRMANQLNIGKNAVLNPDADGKDFAIYLKHINNSGSGHGSNNYSNGCESGGGSATSVNVEYGASVKAFIYAPTGKIDVKGGSLGSVSNNGCTSSSFISTATTTMKGLFIARSVKAHGRTNWNWNTVCASCNYSLREGEEAAQSLKSEELNSGLLIENFPDPFKDKTNIRFVLDKDTHATVKVYDLNGKYITTVFNGDVAAKKEYKMEFDGTDLASGMYIYKVITPEDVHTGKMMLIKE